MRHLLGFYSAIANENQNSMHLVTYRQNAVLKLVTSLPAAASRNVEIHDHSYFHQLYVITFQYIAVSNSCFYLSELDISHFTLCY